MGLTLLCLFHHCLKTGFNCVLHLLKNLIRIEGCSRPRLRGWILDWSRVPVDLVPEVLMAVVWIGMKRMEVGQLVEVGGMEEVVGDD